jgi:hypothetical protein
MYVARKRFAEAIYLMITVATYIRELKKVNDINAVLANFVDGNVSPQDLHQLFAVNIRVCIIVSHLTFRKFRKLNSQWRNVLLIPIITRIIL